MENFVFVIMAFVALFSGGIILLSQAVELADDPLSHAGEDMKEELSESLAWPSENRIPILSTRAWSPNAFNEKRPRYSWGEVPANARHTSPVGILYLVALPRLADMSETARKYAGFSLDYHPRWEEGEEIEGAI